MGFFDNYGQGVNAGVQNFLNVRRFKEDQKLAREKFEQEKLKFEQEKILQAAQMAETRAQTQQRLAITAEMERKAQQEMAMRGELANLTKPMGYESAYGQAMGDPQFVGPPTPEDTGKMEGLMSTPQQPNIQQLMGVLAKYDPKSALAAGVSLQNTEEKTRSNEVMAKLREETRDRIAQLTMQSSLDKQQTLFDHKMQMFELTKNKDYEKQAAEHRHQIDLLTQKIEGLKDVRGMKSGAPAKAPVGYRATPEGDLEPIPGGPADWKMEQQRNADTQQKTSMMNKLDSLAETATTLRDHPGLKGITGLSGMVPNIPGGAAANAQALLDNLTSKAALGSLQELRNSSKTGGALGQVSDKDIQLLKDSLVALARTQSYSEYQKQLDKINEYVAKIKAQMEQGYNSKWKIGDQPISKPGSRFTIKQVK